MTTGTGYLTAIANPNSSGLATVIFRSRKIGLGRTWYCHCEAGFGVRQLVAAVGTNGCFTPGSSRIKVRFTIDDLGLLSTVEVL